VDVCDDARDTVRFDKDRFRSALKHGTASIVGAIHDIDERRVDAAHPRRERVHARHGREMDVIAHDGVCKTTPIRLRERRPEQLQVEEPFVLASDVPVAIDEPRDEVIDGIRFDSTWFARHAKRVVRRPDTLHRGGLSEFRTTTCTTCA